MILQGDCRDVMKDLQRRGVQAHTIVTSPPYWSLRDYGVPPSIWGGDPACQHEWESAGTREGYTSKTKWQHSDNAPDAVTRENNPDGWKQIEQGKFCAFNCGAWLGCLGLEPTPELYVAHMVEVFDAAWDVLREDGTLWLNIGDCYAAGGRGGDTGHASGLEGSKQHQEESKRAGQRIGHRSSFRRDRAARMDVAHKGADGLKPKDLVGIPWMVAFALRARGWYLRSDIIWAKSNPMPESTRDRPTKSHEYLFLLTKDERYFYDAEAIREGAAAASMARVAQRGFAAQKGGPKDYARTAINPNRSSRKALENFAKNSGGGRNRRSVWTIPTAPFPEAHFATFPPRLVTPCIQAGTSEHGCCSICGAPFRRVIELGAPLREQMAVAGADANGEYHGKSKKHGAGGSSGVQNASELKARVLAGMRERVTTGWKATCGHTLREVEPCIVLDPFAGSGTAGLVAAALGRDFIGIELNAEYVAMAERRTAPAEASA